MKRILIAAALIAFAGPATAWEYAHNEGPGMAPKPTLEERVAKLERDAAEQEKQRERAKVDSLPRVSYTTR